MQGQDVLWPHVWELPWGDAAHCPTWNRSVLCLCARGSQGVESGCPLPLCAWVPGCGIRVPSASVRVGTGDPRDLGQMRCLLPPGSTSVTACVSAPPGAWLPAGTLSASGCCLLTWPIRKTTGEECELLTPPEVASCPVARGRAWAGSAHQGCSRTRCRGSPCPGPSRDLTEAESPRSCGHSPPDRPCPRGSSVLQCVAASLLFTAEWRSVGRTLPGLPNIG